MYVGSIWFPTMLSPIPEEDEPHFGIFTERRDLNGEHRGIMVGPDGALSNQNQSAPRGVVPPDQRKSIESSSGRRLPSVEVLKQKYLNDDIQDIPRLIQGPVRYGRLHRSRSHLNLGSQDIKTQLNKIRLRLGAITAGDDTHKEDNDETPTFRCSKYQDESRHGPVAAPTMTLERVRDLLYGSPTVDDYDPELAALFEDYVEECDNPTRATPAETRIRDRYVMGRILMEKALKSETRYAFLSGFLEGIARKSSQVEENSCVDTPEKVIQQSEGTKHSGPVEVAKDPCIDKSSHTMLIRNNQDITHKFLRQWEQQNSSCEADEAADDSCFACHQKKMKPPTPDTDVRETPTTDAGESDSVTDTKLAKGRDLFPLGKPELDLAVPDVPRSPANCIKRTQLKKLPKLQKSKPADSPLLVEALVGTKLPHSQEENPNCLAVGRAGDATIVQGSDDSKAPTPITPQFSSLGDTNDKIPLYRYNRASMSPNLTKRIMSPNLIPLNSIPRTYSPKIFNDCSSIMEKRRPPHTHNDVTSDDDVSVIALAKQRLESKFMSSAMLNDFFRKKQEERKQNKPEPPRTPRREARDENRAMSKGRAGWETDYKLGDLDGWTTSIKYLSDPDNLHDVHVSSSEVMHRIFSPTTPVEQKECKKPREQDDTIKLPRHFTPTSAKLSDLDDKTCRKTNYETTAFKPSSPLAADYKKAASHVKLRLTKSCANMPTTSITAHIDKIDKALSNVASSSTTAHIDKVSNVASTSTTAHIDKAFSNVPLATCNNYYVDDKLKATQEATTNINLSDNLAQQLKNIGRDNNLRTEPVHKIASQTGSQSLVAKSQEKRKAASASTGLPAIQHEAPVDKDKLIMFSDRKLPLPDIGKCKTPDIDKCKTPEIRYCKTPDICKSKTPEFGYSKTPDIGKSKTPDIIKSKTPDIGYSKTPEITRSKTPDIGYSKTPDIGKSKTPDIGKPNAPDIRKSEPPEIGYSKIPDLAKRSVTTSGNTEQRELDRRTPVVDKIYAEGNSIEPDLTVAKPGKTKLPPLSVRSYPKSNNTKSELGDLKQDARPSYDYDIPMYHTGSLAVRAEVCTSAYQFDKADPNNLIVKAKQLPNHHEVCSSCGGISEKLVDKPDKKKEAKHVQKDVDKVNNQRCISPSEEQKWKLEQTEDRKNLELPKLKGEKLFNFKEIMNAKRQSCTQSNTLNKKPTPEEELSFKFMGQNIKLKFECEFNVSTEESKSNKKSPRDGSCQRLQEIAKPTFRDSFKNPVSRETGIYQKKIKPLELSDCRESTASPGKDSPYVDYCKRKTAMRSKRQHLAESELAKLPTDDNAAKKPRKSHKRFPVLPVKKSGGKGAAAKSGSQTGDKKPKSGSDKGMMVQPGRLPVIKQATSRHHTAAGVSRETSKESGVGKASSYSAKVDSCVTCIHTYKLINK